MVSDDRPVFEIELIGPDGHPTSGPASAPTPSDGRSVRTRRASLAAAFGAGVIGILIASAVIADDDPTGSSTSASVSTTLPVLPTLPRLDELRATDESDPASSAGTVYKSIRPPRTALSGEPIVDLPTPLHTGGFTVGSFILSDRTVGSLDDALPRRSTTDHVVGADGYRQRVVITNDPTSGRYRLDLVLRLDGRTTTGSIVIDLVDDVVWLPVGTDEWTTVPGDELARRVGYTSMADYVRRLQLGPLRSDTRADWSDVRSNGLVEYPGEDEPLAEWTVTMDAGDVPVWSRYALGPLAEAAPLPDTAPVAFTAYVTSTGVLRRVTAEIEFGATIERVDHRIDLLTQPMRIDLPGPDPGMTGTTTPETSAPDTGDQL